MRCLDKTLLHKDKTRWWSASTALSWRDLSRGWRHVSRDANNNGGSSSINQKRFIRRH